MNSLFVVSKKDPVENREYIVAFNNSDTDESVEITSATSSGGWQLLLGQSEAVASSNKVTFMVPALSTLIFKANSPIDVVETKVGKIKTSLDDMTGFYQVKAGLVSSDFLSVEFFTRTSGTSKWISNGVDTNAPYSIFLDPIDFAKKKIEIKAVATNSKGENFVTSIAKLSIPAP
jgi:hypothetical protein